MGTSSQTQNTPLETDESEREWLQD
jgi:hypothetical protein